MPVESTNSCENQSKSTNIGNDVTQIAKEVPVKAGNGVIPTIEEASIGVGNSTTHMEEHGLQPTSSDQTNTTNQTHTKQLRKSLDGRIYLEPHKKSYHPHQAIRDLGRIIKKQFVGPWCKWDEVPQEVKNLWFSEFKKLYTWEDKFDADIKRNYVFLGRRRLRSIIYNAKVANNSIGIKPVWISNDNWDELKRKWSNPHYQKLAVTNSRNRLSHKDGLGPSCHIGGSIPYSEHKRKYEEATGKEAIASQLFLMTHKHKKTGEFVDSKSKATWEKFESQMRESLGDTSSIATNNNNEEDSTQKELTIWTKVVGGLTKGRIYGLGSEASSVPTQNMPLTIPQTSSTMQESLEHVEKR